MPSKLSLQVTTRCDKGCRICFANSAKTSPSLPLSVIRNVLEQVPANIPVSFTGGEPFLYRDGSNDLSDLVDLLHHRSSRASIISSGWSPGDEPYQSIFARLIKYFPELEIGTSFNLYQKPGIEDRVKALLRLVLNYGGNSWINVVISQVTAAPTLKRLFAVLRELSLTPEDPRAARRLIMRESYERVSFCAETGNRITVQPMKLQAAGRAKNLSEPLFVDHEDCGFLRGENRMAIAVNGDVYICESPSTMEGPGLGNVTQEPVSEIITRFERFRQELSSALLHSRFQYADVCMACVALRHGILQHIR